MKAKAESNQERLEAKMYGNRKADREQMLTKMEDIQKRIHQT
jgi:hypothetical protein